MEEPHADECSRVRAQLDDFLDQEPTTLPLSLLLAHLEVCAPCAACSEQAYQELAALREAAQRVRAPDGLMERLTRRLARQRREDRNWG